MQTTEPQSEKTAPAPALPVPARALRTRQPATKWLSAADEIVDYLQRHETEKESWWRTTSATIALLKNATRLVENAKKTISVQEKRIQVLEDMATTDDLTGLLNRRGFFTAFARELDRATRDKLHGRGGLLMLIDLDNFKAINDTYGQAAGDAALKLVGRTLAHDIRTMDVAARLGGDEFVLLFADTTREAALERAQKLVWRLNHLSLIWFGAELPVRASLGIQEYKSGDKPDKIFSDADVRLYASKQSMKGITTPAGSFATPL